MNFPTLLFPAWRKGGFCPPKNHIFQAWIIPAPLGDAGLYSKHAISMDFRWIFTSSLGFTPIPAAPRAWICPQIHQNWEDLPEKPQRRERVKSKSRLFFFLGGSSPSRGHRECAGDGKAFSQQAGGWRVTVPDPIPGSLRTEPEAINARSQAGVLLGGKRWNFFLQE